GFMTQEYGLAGKHLELLKEIVPDVTRGGVVRDSSSIAGIGQFGAIQSIAPSLNVELSPLGLRDKDEIERGITAFGRRPNSGLVVTGTALTVVHRPRPRPTGQCARPRRRGDRMKRRTSAR